MFTRLFHLNKKKGFNVQKGYIKVNIQFFHDFDVENIPVPTD